MSQRPVAIGVNSEVGSVGEGVTVLLLSVEVWSSRVVLHLAARENTVTRALLADWQAVFDAWAQSGAHGPPPADPARVLHEQLSVSLDDEAGHSFELSAAQYGGQGTQWSATQVYPCAPKGHLTLTFDSKSERQTIVIPLHE